MQEALGEAGDHVGVFLPCAPNPTTGFFFYLPRADIREIPISVDDAAKLVMSAGVIQPEDPQAAAPGDGGDPAGGAGRQAAGGRADPAPPEAGA